jgi:hypothetical protein
MRFDRTKTKLSALPEEPQIAALLALRGKKDSDP